MNTYSYERDNLLSGDFPLVTRSVVVASGQSLKRGALLGEVGDTVKQAASTATDGSETATAVLAEDVDASGGEKRATAYLTGQFNERAIGFANGDTPDTFRANLRPLSIFLEPSVSK